jgi:hypothetical protein
MLIEHQHYSKRRQGFSPARLEPTVEDLFNPLEVSFALLRRDHDVINVLSMQVLDTRSPRQFLELLDGADADNLTTFSIALITLEISPPQDQRWPTEGLAFPNIGSSRYSNPEHSSAILRNDPRQH